MSTILIPTDFSPAAYNAANYSLHLAEKIKAGIKLCNAIKVPAESALAGQVAWPLEDYTSLKKNAEVELEYLAKKLTHDAELIDSANTYQPGIQYCSGVGEVADYVRNIVDEEDINVVVMGMSGAGILSRLFLGSNSRKMINKSDFPLLLIPATATFKGIKKIAFATDLSSQDLLILQSLAGFAKHFNADILLTHIIDSNTDRKQVDKFLSDVTCKIDYPNIYYRGIKNMGVNEGLNWLTDNVKIDMLVMVHRQQPFFTWLLNSSYTQQLAKDIHLPLLVFPNNYKGVLA